MNKAERTKYMTEIRRKVRIKHVLANTFDDFNLLAIDPATACGWAMSPQEYGCWSLDKKKGESDGAKWLKLEVNIKNLIKNRNVRIVGFELPVVGMMGATIHHAKLNAIIERTCAELEVEYKTFSPSEIKLFATGRGNAKKPEMIEAARVHFGYEGDNDNEADALWILALLKDFLISKI